MAKQIKASEIFENEDIFKGVRESASETIAVLEQMETQVKQTANELKQSIGRNKMDSSKTIKQFADDQSKANKLMMESIKIEEMKQKTLKTSESVETQRKKTMQETERLRQQSIKSEQENERNQQQRIKTKREQMRLDRQIALEIERKQKAEERSAKLARDEASAYKQLERSTRELKNASKELAAQLIQLERDGKKNTEQFHKLSREYRDTTKAAKQADQQLKQIDQRVGDNFRNVGNYTGAINKLRNGLGALGLAFGVGEIVRSGVGAIIEFDQSIADLSAITGASGKDLEYFKKQANELGKEVEGGATSVVEAYKLIGSAKPELLANSTALNQVTKSAITLSQAAGMEVPEAATALTDAMNQFGASAEEADRYINVLAAGSKFGSVEIPQVTEALLKFGAVAKTTNVSIEESSALIEALGEKGLKGAEAGTALRNVMLKLSAPDALPKEAIDRLTALGVNFDVLKDKSIPFTDRLRALKPLLNDAGAMVKVFGTENAVAATNLISLTDRTDELKKSMTGTNTAYEQAETRTNTLGHALMELKNSFLGLFTTMASGEGSGQWLIDFMKWIAENLPTIVSMLFKLVRAWLAYQLVIKSIQAYQWAASGGFKELGKSILSNISLTNRATSANEKLATSAKTAGTASQNAGRLIGSIGWMAIITALIEVATHWYDVASGAAEARRQSDLYSQAQSLRQKIDDKSASERQKNMAREIAELQRQRNEGKITELEFRKQTEAINQNYLSQANANKKMNENIKKDLQGRLEYINETMGTEGELTEQAIKWVQQQYKEFGFDSGDAWFGLLKNANQGMYDLKQQFTAQINAINESIQKNGDEVDDLNEQYKDASSQVRSYNVEIANNSGKIKNNWSDIKTTATEFKTELDAVNDYLERTLDLLQQINEIRQDRELLKMDDEIEAAINNAVKLVKETGTINVGVEANTDTGEFGSMYDPIEQMIIDRYNKEKEFIQQRTDFAIDELQRQFDSETALEKQKLIDERDELLKQENITTDAKNKINSNYDQRLKELEIEQNQRAIDLELDKQLLREKSVDDQTKLLEDQNKEIDDYNDKLLNGEQEFLDERNEKWLESNEKIIESEKLLWQTISDYVKSITDFFIEQSQKRIDQIDKEIQAAEKQFDVYKELAASGNILASQSLAEQQRIIAEKQREKEKLERRQQRLKLVESVFSTYNAKVQSGSKNAIAETFRDATLLTQFIKTLPTFESGTIDTGKNGRGVDGRGGFHSILHPNERVVPKHLNEKIGGMSNEQLTKLAIEYQNAKTFGTGATAIDSPLNFAVLVDKMDQLNQTIKNKPETNIGIGEITQSAMEIVERKTKGNTTTYNRYKIK